MSFPYKHVLLLGATSGIGLSMANRLIKEGSKVIAVGRRQDRLDAFVQEHGKSKASAVKFDISNRAGIDSFVSEVTKMNPDLDCVFLNAGTQSAIDLASPSKVDLRSFHSEIETNFTSFVDLTMKFLPFLMAKKEETGIIYTGSNLAIVPAATMPAYSVSKAALNTFMLCLREQLRDSSVKIIEISPPVVQTELHDYMGAEKGRAMGMPADQFTDEAYKGLAAGKDQIGIGSIGPPEQFYDIVDKRRTAFENLAKIMRSH